jgi:hypothetical protein
MRTGLIELGIAILGGFLLALLMFKCGGKSEKEIVEVVVEVLRVDTVFNNDSPKPIKVSPKPVKDTLQYDSVRYYSGRHTFQNGYFDYKLKTLGYLDSYTFSPTVFIPQTTITRTIMQEKPRLYALASVGNQQLSVGAIYTRERMMYGYSYNPVLNQHSFSVGVRLY